MVGLSFPKSWRAFSVRLVSNCVRLGWTCVLMSRALVRGTFSCRANRIILLTIDEVDEAGRASDKRVAGWSDKRDMLRLLLETKRRRLPKMEQKTAKKRLEKAATNEVAR